MTHPRIVVASAHHPKLLCILGEWRLSTPPTNTIVDQLGVRYQLVSMSATVLFYRDVPGADVPTTPQEPSSC